MQVSLDLFEGKAIIKRNFWFSHTPKTVQIGANGSDAVLKFPSVNIVSQSAKFSKKLLVDMTSAPKSTFFFQEESALLDKFFAS